MPRVLMVIFDNETEAREGEKVLLQLDREGSIRVHCHAVLAKQTDGAVRLLQTHDFGLLDSLLSTPVASLIALLGGPEGLAPSAATGFTFGRGADTYNARLGEDFVDDVGKALLAGKSAVVAEISENWTARVDAGMEQIGGIVFRRTLSGVRRTRNEDDLAAMQGDVDQLKDEQSLSGTERKAELQEKIDQLDSKMRALEKTKDGCGGTWQAHGEGLPVGTGLAESKNDEAPGQWSKPLTHSYESRHDIVEELAYQHWEKRGRPFGSPEVDWFAAEQALRSYLLASGLQLGEGGDLYR